MYTEPDNLSWEERWAKGLEGARHRPAMYIGDPVTAHLYFISTAYHLLWQAKVFRSPIRARVDLSTDQYVVRCDAGPLIRPVQRLFTFPGGPLYWANLGTKKAARISNAWIGKIKTAG